jgi:hypothetical protein
MSETTHTLLEDAANLVEEHGTPVLADRLRRAKQHIPDVPLAPRPGPKVSEVFGGMAQMLRDKHHVIFPDAGGGFAGGYSGMQDRDKDLNEARIYQAIADVHKGFGQ